MFLGSLIVKVDEMSEPENRLFHHLGMIAGGTGKRFLGSSKTILIWESFDPMRGGTSNCSLAVVMSMWQQILTLTLFLCNHHSDSPGAMGTFLEKPGRAGFAGWFLNSGRSSSSLTLQIP